MRGASRRIKVRFLIALAVLIGVAGRRFQTNGRGYSVLAGESCGDAGYIFAPGNEARRGEQEARRYPSWVRQLPAYCPGLPRLRISPEKV